MYWRLDQFLNPLLILVTLSGMVIEVKLPVKPWNEKRPIVSAFVMITFLTDEGIAMICSPSKKGSEIVFRLSHQENTL